MEISNMNTQTMTMDATWADVYEMVYTCPIRNRLARLRRDIDSGAVKPTRRGCPVDARFAVRTAAGNITALAVDDLGREIATSA
jgi:hypothetical protein